MTVVGKATGRRAAQAGGINLATDTPDVVFSDKRPQDETDLPEEDVELALSPQPGFDSLMLQTGPRETDPARATEVRGTELSEVSIVDYNRRGSSSRSTGSGNGGASMRFVDAHVEEI